jgi:hypothetical protein
MDVGEGVTDKCSAPTALPALPPPPPKVVCNVFYFRGGGIVVGEVNLLYTVKLNLTSSSI